jgi:drug/metabolite transporter (DMT)-like permease
MPASAFFLALGAAALHAAWNVLLARADDVRAATTVTLALSVVLFAPAAAATWDVEAEAVPWIAASAVLELAYFLLLTSAYGRSDLSLVYPVARGVAPVLVLAGATVTGAALGAWAAFGVVLVGVGVVLVRGLRGPVDTRGLALALAIALTIAGYTLVDKEGIEHASPVAYLELVLLPVALVVLLSYVTGERRSALRSELGWATAVAAAASFGAYALVLAALSLAAAPAVAAVRETSILFAVALAAVVLRERVGGVRVAGAALVVVGVALVAAGG